MAVLVVVLVSALGVGASAFWVLTILPGSLPSVAQLETFDASEGTKVYDDNDELITEFHVERRIFVPLAQIPRSLRDAVLATEDRRFYQHWGIDPIGIGRAVWQNYRRGRVVEGALGSPASSVASGRLSSETDLPKKVRAAASTPKAPWPK